MSNVIWRPQEGPQTHLIKCPVFEIFYGGARGGGKTEASIGDWLQHSNQYGNLAIGIFFRRTFRQLSEVIARTKQIFPSIGAKYHENNATWTMSNGARLRFADLEKDSDAGKYQGHSYTRVYVEEATNFPSPEPINKLRATLRSGSGVVTGMRLTGNPGGPGHSWVKKRYIEPCRTGYKVITETETIVLDGKEYTESLDRVFIPSKLSDNRLIMEYDPSYIMKLYQSGSKTLVDAWLQGDWDAIEGSFFSEWDNERHVLSTEEVLPIIPKDCLRFRSFDWGGSSPFSVGWYALLNKELKLQNGRVLPKNALIKYHEWYGAETTNTGSVRGLKMGADLIAKGIVEREKGMPKVSYGVADPSIRNKYGGPSIMEVMAVHQCRWNLADNNREAGHNQIRQRLRGEPGGEPMLFFLDCCADSIRTFPIQQHESENSEDLDTDAEDHAVDETRYAVMSRPLNLTNHVSHERFRPDYHLTFNGMIGKQRAKQDKE